MADVDTLEEKTEVDDEKAEGGGKKEDDDASEKTGDDDDTGDEQDSAGKGAEDEGGDGYSTELLNQAEVVGFSEEEARELGSPANLQKAVDMVAGKMADVGRAEFDERSRTQKDEDDDEEEPARRRPSRRRANRGRSREDAKPKEKLPDYDPEIDAEEYPTVSKAMKALNKRHAAELAERDERIDEMREDFDDFRDGVNAKQLEADRAEVNRAIDSLPDEWAEIFGKGQIRDGSREHENRNKILPALAGIAGTALQRSGRMPSTVSLVELAARVTFGKHAEKMTRKTLTKKASKRSRQITNRPTGKKHAEDGGRAKAIKRAEAYSAEQDAANAV